MMICERQINALIWSCRPCPQMKRGGVQKPEAYGFIAAAAAAARIV